MWRINQGVNMMICPRCGLDLRSSIDKPIEENNMEVKEDKGERLIGFSDLIRDPAFDSYRKQSIAWSFIFASILALMVIVSFYIYGERSSEMDNPQAIYIGMGIGGMFVSIAGLQTFFRSKDSTYDMVLVDKKIENIKRKVKSQEGSYIESYTLYTLFFKTDTGDGKVISTEDDDYLYNFYKTGDKVRHHKGLTALEKYDKRGDTEILCIACGTVNSIEDDKCYRCSCPLLK